jgi:hypothetical protein
MQHPKCLYKSEVELTIFEFFTEGPRGRIKKVVQYSLTGTKNVYNLGFGDFDEDTGEISDLSVTNNGDSLRVLATVASTVYAFMKKYPDAWIFVTGSTPARNRLYRMGISNNLDEISTDFFVYGYTSDGLWEVFTAGAAYEAFLLTKKSNNFVL